MGTFRKVAMLLSLGLAVSGCASIIKGSTQSITISTPPTTGAICNLSNGQDNWEVMSPGAASVDKSKADIQIRCTKPGWQAATSNFEGWTVGNLVFGGIIGLGVDAATGAINEYPRTFQVPMSPLSAPGDATPMAQSALPPTLAPAPPTPFAQRAVSTGPALTYHPPDTNRYGLPPACYQDADTICGDVQRGGGRIVACLRRNATSVSTVCSNTISTGPS